MNGFQKTIIIILIIVLLIICTTTFFIIRYANTNQPWPPIESSCPDYWELDKNNICINKKNLGTCNQDQMDFNVAPFNTSTGDCSKYNWATKCNVSWDGITYGVSNPCNS